MIFLNTQINLFILKTDVEKFTSTYEKTLHLIFKVIKIRRQILVTHKLDIKYLENENENHAWVSIGITAFDLGWPWTVLD